MKRQSMLLGVTILAVCGIIAKFIGAFYKIPLMHILGTNGMGVYYLIFPFYSMMLTIASSGLSLAVVKMVSLERAHGLVTNQRRIFRVAISYVMIVTVFIGILMVIFSESISVAQGNISARLGYVAIAPALIFSGMIAVARGYFQGLTMMWPTSLSTLMEQIIKVGLGLFFSHLFLQRGLEYGVFGAVLGVTMSEFVAFLVMFFQYFLHQKDIRKDSDLSQKVLSYSEIAKTLFRYSLPATISSLVLPVSSFIDSFLLIHLLEKSGLSNVISTSLYGISNGIITTLINLPIVLISALSTVMVPNISGCLQEEKKEICFKCSLFVKTTWLITIPCFVSFYFLAPEIINILYHYGLSNQVIPEYNYAYSLLKISSITIIYYAFLHTFTSILQSINKPLLPCISLGIGIVVRTVFCILLVSNIKWNIYGLVISNFFFLLIACLLNVYFVKKYVALDLSFKRFFVVPIFAGVLSGFTIYLTKMLLCSFVHLYIYSVVSFVAGMIVYFGMVILLKAYNSYEISKIWKRKKKVTVLQDIVEKDV